MKVGSLFSGIGGFDLFSFVSLRWMEFEKTILKKRDGEFFKLDMPNSVGFAINNNKIFRTVVMFIKIDMMNHLTHLKWSSSLPCSHKNMFCDIAKFVGIGMRWLKNVKVSISKSDPLSPLSFFLSNKNSATSPICIELSRLVSFGGLTRWYSHLFHGSPNDLLGCLVFVRNLMLGHTKLHIIPEKFFLCKRGIVSVLVHAGIIAYANK